MNLNFVLVLVAMPGRFAFCGMNDSIDCSVPTLDSFGNCLLLTTYNDRAPFFADRMEIKEADSALVSLRHSVAKKVNAL